MDANIEFHFVKNECFLLDNKVKIPLVENEKLYYLNAIKSLPLAKKSALDWHNTMGHLNFNDICRMPKMVNGMLITHTNKQACITCLQGKSKEALSKLPDQRSNKPFDFVHSDLLGPMHIKDSIDDANYLINFVCDYSNYTVVYAMESKAGVPLAFEKFLHFTSRFGKVTRLRTDKGTEYTSQAMEAICRKHSIFHETSVAYTPSMNGTAERSF